MDQKKPFPFTDQAQTVMDSYLRDVGEEFASIRGTYVDNRNVHRFSHGTAWQSHNSYAPDRVSNLQTQSYDSYLRFEDLATGRLEVITETKAALVSSMFEGFSRSFFQTISQICEENDRVIPNSKSRAEQLVAAIESVEFSVDREGTVHLPQIMLGTQAMKDFEADSSLRTPELEARMQVIKTLKTAQALEREAARKAKFVKGEK